MSFDNAAMSAAKGAKLMSVAIAKRVKYARENGINHVRMSREDAEKYVDMLDKLAWAFDQFSMEFERQREKREGK
jgi:hypothetical protein